MTRHADVIGECRRERCRIHDRRIVTRISALVKLRGEHMCEPWTMAVLAPDRKLRKGRIGEMPIFLRQCIGTSTVAGNAARQNGTIEARVAKLVSGRQFPSVSFGVERQGGLEEVVSSFHQPAKAVLARADDPSDLACIAE